jgi:pimeloyl-ACP methyl ester carboxylesterase
VLDYIVELARASAGRSRPFDEAAVRAVGARVIERSTNIESSMRNHNAMDDGARWRDRLVAIRAPTLVVHGTEDPVVPLGNGLALADEIPAAELLTLDGTGHELPRAVWDVLVPAILAHTEPA